MRSRAEWEAEQNRLLARYEDAQATLERIPGVVYVGVGLRHRANSLVEEAVYIVAVREKRTEADVSHDERIPHEIFGIPTDVVLYKKPISALGFSDEKDLKNYKTKVGGIAINCEDSNGIGTLGCFCKQNTGGKTVMLSCHHVLFEGSAKIGSGVGQPKFDRKMCCAYNEIGKVLKGDPNVDCAIASLNDGVAFFPKIKRIKRGDGTIEEDGLIKGTAEPVITDVVHKVGWKTGLTRGKVTQITPVVLVEPLPAFARFCDRGDSGSVIIESTTKKVVALLYEMTDDTGKVAHGRKISAVEALMGVKVLESDTTATYTERDIDEDAVDTFKLPPTSPFNAIAEGLRQSDVGTELLAMFEKHREECFQLVNARRGFTVAWHRCKGPTWLAALARSAREPIYQLPDAIGDVSRATAIREITDALMAEGSEALCRDLAFIREPVTEAFANAETVDALAQHLELLHVTTHAPTAHAAHMQVSA